MDVMSRTKDRSAPPLRRPLLHTRPPPLPPLPGAPHPRLLRTQPRPGSPDVAVHGGHVRNPPPEEAAKQVRPFAGPGDGNIAGISAKRAGRSLSQIGSRTERSAGVVEHDGPHSGLLGGVGEAL